MAIEVNIKSIADKVHLLFSRVMFDRDFILDLTVGDIFVHGGKQMIVEGRAFVSPGAGSLSATIYVSDVT